MDLNRPIARTLDEPARIAGLAPLELASCAVFYAVLSPILRGVPFAALISLTASIGLAISMIVLNRTYPPSHGILLLLQWMRPAVTTVSDFGLEVNSEKNKR